jgi:hypothetical protein
LPDRAWHREGRHGPLFKSISLFHPGKGHPESSGFNSRPEKRVFYLAPFRPAFGKPWAHQILGLKVKSLTMALRDRILPMQGIVEGGNRRKEETSHSLPRWRGSGKRTQRCGCSGGPALGEGWKEQLALSQAPLGRRLCPTLPAHLRDPPHSTSTTVLHCPLVTIHTRCALVDV